MTLVVCLKGKDGLVLAADSRGTIGDPRGLTAINDSMIKLFKLSTYVGVLTYGQAELAAQLIQEMKKTLSSEDLYISQIVSKTRNILRTRYNEWFKNFPQNERRKVVVVGFIISRLEEDNSTKTYYSNSTLDFAPQLVVTGIAMGGVPQYATYLTHRLFNSDMSIEEVIRLAHYVIIETATQDPKVGGPIRVAKITTENGFEVLNQSDINEIKENNKNINKTLQHCFYVGDDSEEE